MHTSVRAAGARDRHLSGAELEECTDEQTRDGPLTWLCRESVEACTVVCQTKHHA
jgi:hypothetical protein